MNNTFPPNGTMDSHNIHQVQNTANTNSITVSVTGVATTFPVGASDFVSTSGSNFMSQNTNSSMSFNGGSSGAMASSSTRVDNNIQSNFNESNIRW